MNNGFPRKNSQPNLTYANGQFAFFSQTNKKLPANWENSQKQVINSPQTRKTFYGKSIAELPDLDWKIRTSNFSGNTTITSVAFGNNLWVAGGYAGQLRTSTDTITWVTRTSNFGTTNITSVAFGNSLWVAGGLTGQLRTSTDAVTWVTQTSNFGTTSILSVAFGNGLWVAGGASGQIRTSTDAITWVTSTFAGAYGARSTSHLVYANNAWFGACRPTDGSNPGTASIVCSIDEGSSWFLIGVFSSVGSGDNIFSLAFNPLTNTFAARGSDGSGSSRFSTSIGGFSWYEVWPRNAFQVPLGTNISCANNMFFSSIGSETQIAMSIDGINWVTRNNPVQNTTLTGVVFANGVYVARGGTAIATAVNGNILTSRPPTVFQYPSQAPLNVSR